MDVDDKCAGGCGDDDSVSEGTLDTGCSSYLFIPRDITLLAFSRRQVKLDLCTSIMIYMFMNSE